VPQGSRMETAAQDVERSRRKRQYHRTAEEKRRMVEDTCTALSHQLWFADITHWRDERRIRIGLDSMPL
jgi:hypothetical protein